MKKLRQFAASGSCMAKKKIIVGKVIDDITFVSNEFTKNVRKAHPFRGGMDSTT